MIELFEQGWEKLPLDKRLEIWLERNPQLDEIARTTIENFVISCKKASHDDYRNFRYIDIINFPEVVQETLLEGFFAVYNTSEAFLKLRDYNDKRINPELN